MNNNGRVSLQSNTLLFIDSTSKLSLQNIDNKNFKALNTFTFQQLSTEYCRYNFWLKFTVNNPTDSIIDALFTTGVHKSVDVFRKVGKNYTKLQSTNQTLRPNERPYKFDESYLPLKFEPKQSYELLVKVTEHPQLYFKLTPNW